MSRLPSSRDPDLTSQLLPFVYEAFRLPYQFPHVEIPNRRGDKIPTTLHYALETKFIEAAIDFPQGTETVLYRVPEDLNRKGLQALLSLFTQDVVNRVSLGGNI